MIMEGTVAVWVINFILVEIVIFVGIINLYLLKKIYK
jgi:hypothetical protein